MQKKWLRDCFLSWDPKDVSPLCFNCPFHFVIESTPICNITISFVFQRWKQSYSDLYLINSNPVFMIRYLSNFIFCSLVAWTFFKSYFILLFCKLVMSTVLIINPNVIMCVLISKVMSLSLLCLMRGCLYPAVILCLTMLPVAWFSLVSTNIWSGTQTQLLLDAY